MNLTPFARIDPGHQIAPAGKVDSDPCFSFDHPNSKRPGGSEDLALFIWPDFTPEDEDEIQRRAKELGIYGKSMKLSRMSPQEFPEDTIRPPPQRKAPASSAKKSKSRRKMAKKSRKANR